MPCVFVKCGKCGKEGHNARTCGRPRNWRKKQRNGWANKWVKKTRVERRKKGLCIRCQAPCKPFKQCQDCRAGEADRRTKNPCA